MSNIIALRRKNFQQLIDKNYNNKCMMKYFLAITMYNTGDDISAYEWHKDLRQYAERINRIEHIIHYLIHKIKEPLHRGDHSFTRIRLRSLWKERRELQQKLQLK